MNIDRLRSGFGAHVLAQHALTSVRGGNSGGEGEGGTVSSGNPEEEGPPTIPPAIQATVNSSR